MEWWRKAGSNELGSGGSDAWMKVCEQSDESHYRMRKVIEEVSVGCTNSASGWMQTDAF